MRTVVESGGKRGEKQGGSCLSQGIVWGVTNVIFSILFKSLSQVVIYASTRGESKEVVIVTLQTWLKVGKC
jgi:hypothetical protein